MKTCRSIFKAIVLVFGWGANLYAHPISDRYVLVGVIASGSSAKGAQRGIAVIRDQTVNRTLTIAVGEFLPYSQWKITQVARDTVTAEMSGQEAAQIRYELGAPSQPSPLVSMEKKEDEDSKVPTEETDKPAIKNDSYDEWRTFFEDRDEPN